MSRLRAAACLAVLVLAAPVARGQPYGTSPFDEEVFRSLTPARRGPEPPPLEFVPVEEIEIPGPLHEAELDVVGPEIRVRVLGALATIVHGPETAEVRVDPVVEVADAASGQEWVRGGRKGHMRFRTESEGRVVAEKRNPRSIYPWRKKWGLRIPGGTPAPPLPVGGRVFVGSTDSRVYALKARNGHRLWAQDVGERVEHPLAHWRGDLGGEEIDLVLVVPDDERRLLVLDPFDGRTLASYRLPDTGESLATGPAVTADGHVAVAVQKYAPDKAALLLLEIHAVRTGPEPVDVPYNEPGDEMRPPAPGKGKTAVR